MECPNCKKQLADNALSCPECGYNFQELKNKKATQQGCIVFLVLIVILASVIGGCVNSVVDEVETDKQNNKITAEDIQQATNFVETMEAAGLIKKINNKCADGSTGCYYFMIEERLWEYETNYEVKQNLAIASEIYASSKSDYKFYEGKGYNNGKTLYNMWGIK